MWEAGGKGSLLAWGEGCLETGSSIFSSSQERKYHGAARQRNISRSRGQAWASRPSTSRPSTAPSYKMSAFAVLQGAEDGDVDRLVQKKKSQLAKESAKREAEAAASRAAFDDLKAKAGQSNWADDDEEDDDFYSLPVRCAHTGTEHVSSSYLCYVQTKTRLCCCAEWLECHLHVPVCDAVLVCRARSLCQPADCHWHRG